MSQTSLYLLATSACCFDLFLSCCRELCSLYGELLGDFAIAENLETVLSLADYASVKKSLDINDSTILEAVEVAYVNG